MSDSDLAWCMVGEVDFWLTDPDRGWVYVELGSGDHIRAIERMVALVARDGVELPLSLVIRLRSWLHRYAGFADTLRIADLLDFAAEHGSGI